VGRGEGGGVEQAGFGADLILRCVKLYLALVFIAWCLIKHGENVIAGSCVYLSDGGTGDRIQEHNRTCNDNT